MANDEKPLAGEQAAGSSMALLPANLPDSPNGEWSSPIAQVQAASSGPDLMVYWHAFRRHWVMAVGIGLLASAIGGPIVWFSIGPKYSTEAFLRVSMQEIPVAFPGANSGYVDKDRFEIYKNTQQQLMLSRYVIAAALRRPEVAKLDVIQREQEKGDVINWVAEHVSVYFPGKAEVMQVSMTHDDPVEATTLVRGIVDAYLTEVVNAERDTKLQRISELQRAFVEKETEVRERREDLKKLAEQLGTSDSETLTLKQKIALEELTLYRNEMTRTQFEIQRLQRELSAQKALLASVDTRDVDALDLDELVQRDPVARQLFVELGWRKIDQVYTQGAVVEGAQSRYASRYSQDLKTMQDQFDARREELAKTLKQKARSEIEQEIRKLEISIEVMTEQLKTAMVDVEQKKAEAERFGVNTVDIEMMRADIKNLETVLSGIAQELEKLKVESRAMARVKLVQRAEVPEVASNERSRIAMTLFVMIVAMCCPGALLAFWDSRSKRINTCNDVSKGLGLQVIGSVPLIPPRIIRRLGSPSRRYQTWQIRLTESVDGIAARVLRKAETNQCRVVMVSSASGGEGKTTLATQLAMSLARVGRRTVLVDFDLRRPAFDEVFGLPLEPGVCEALRDRDSGSVFVHEISTENLSVVTAGRWDRNAMAALSNGAAAAMFKKLREEFEFVVVDTSPILPVADSRFVSQHVDSVVLSVFRDISQAPKIQAACEILAAFGVHTVEAVVTGPNVNMYGEHIPYESTISA